MSDPLTPLYETIQPRVVTVAQQATETIPNPLNLTRTLSRPIRFIWRAEIYEGNDRVNDIWHLACYLSVALTALTVYLNPA